MSAARVLSTLICILLTACAVEAGTMTVGQTRDYQNGGYFIKPGEITDHAPWQRGAIEDWGWSYDLSALAPADATGIVSATLTVKAWCMDTSRDEVDEISAGGVALGNLGWDGAWANWEVTWFSLPATVTAALLRDKRLDCSIDIDKLYVGHRVTLKWAQLVVTYAVPGSDRAGVYDPSIDPDSFPDPPSPYYQPGTQTDPEDPVHPGDPPSSGGSSDPCVPSHPVDPTDPGDTSQPVQPTPPALRIVNGYNDGREVMGPAWELWYTQNSSEKLDPCDAVFQYPNQMLPAVISTVEGKNLQRDVRPKGHRGPIVLSLWWAYGPRYPAGSTGTQPQARNYLSVCFPSGGTFGDAKYPITLQQIYGPSHATYPPYDLRQLIANGDIDTTVNSINHGLRVGIVPLADFTPQKVILEQPYAVFELYTDKVSVADYNGNGVIDANDYAAWVRDFGVTGPSASDIASLKNGKIVVGVPDGKVDETDRRAFEAERAKYPDPKGPFMDGFEGTLANAWTGEGDWNWWITTDESHGPTHSMRAGPAGDNESTSLVLTRSCAQGTIRFWQKTSTEKRYDVLRFFINGVQQEEASGETDWQQVSFAIPAAGQTVFEWRYQKDGSNSLGRDTVWIDDVEIVAAN